MPLKPKPVTDLQRQLDAAQLKVCRLNAEGRWSRTGRRRSMESRPAYIRRLAIMADANVTPTMLEMNTVQALAHKFEIEPIPLEIRRTDDIESAFARLKTDQADALYVVINELLNANRLLIVRSAEAAKIPAIYGTHDWVRSGGLISYGSNFPALFARLAEMADSILRGTKAEDIPVEQPTRFELVINLKTSKAIGVTIPATLLARADDVIE